MADFKKAPVKVNENGAYIDIAPETYADIVYSNDSRNGTVRSELNELKTGVNAAQALAAAAAVLVVSATEPSAPTKNMIWIKP